MSTRKRPSGDRAPLTTEQLQQLTASDFLRLKLTEDEKVRLRVINAMLEVERIQRSARLRIEEEPLLSELREVGWNCESVWDLVNTSKRYPEAIPVLLKHLQLPYSDRTREGIARSLAVREAKSAWPIIVSEYKKATIGWGIKAPGDKRKFPLGAKDGLACALRAAVTDETLEELIALAEDPTHGESRLLLLAALRRSRSASAKQALNRLASDPDLKKEIASWRKR